MATITGFTASRMLEIENESIVDGDVDVAGHLILKTREGSEIDAGSVRGPTGPSSRYDIPSFPPGVRSYVKLAELDGVAALSGAHLSFLLSGLGGYGSTNRTTVLVHAGQRGVDGTGIKAWAWGDSSSVTPIELFTRRITDLSFEIWAKLALYTFPSSLTVLSNFRGTIAIGSVTPTAPSDLVAWPIISMDAPQIPAVENTTHRLTVPHSSGGWMTKGADGTTYGPFKYVKTYVPVPGDMVWLAKDGSGTLRIMGAEQEWQDLPLTNAITYNANNAQKEWQEPQFKVRHGFVTLRGLLALSNVGSQVLIATLPVGARPDKAIVIKVDNSGITRALYIRPDGTVRMGIGHTQNGYYSLDGIVFPVAGKANWTYVGDAGSGLAFANGWTHYSSGTSEYGKVGFWKDEYDYVWMTGLISSGTTTGNTNVIIVTNPDFVPWSGSSPSTSGEQHLATCSAELLGGINVLGNPSGSHAIRVGAAVTNSATWVSLCGLSYQTIPSYDHSDWVEHPTERLMGGGWKRLGTPYPTFAWRQRLDGMVTFKGLLDAGTFSVILDYLPPSCRTQLTSLIHTVSNGGLGRIDVVGWDASGFPGQAGAFRITSGSSAWMSLDGLHYFPD